MIYILWLFIPLVLLLLIVPALYLSKKKRTWLFLIYILVLGWGAYYIFYQSGQPKTLQPNQTIEIKVKPKDEGADPVTELYFDNQDGGRLLLTGQDVWYDEENKLTFDVKKARLLIKTSEIVIKT
ncbi:hypothetical protein [Streptococcus oricebi]|uniref:Uncharacterized protein n=1 Tax=Streptococcus oricebi TaxID=1547447 RepID=A0ABS5B401_9STRE|nr:hypothetical protein [Streptococcus oricebi]MBP2623548.1 hypothetical protein [Streptococcus oricebi]